MINLLRDPVWQFIGAILAIIAIGISIFIYLVQRQLKKLSYELHSATSLLSVADEVKGKLKIFYDDKPISNAHLLIVSFKNTGNMPIIESDFVNPLRVVFNESVKIIAAETFELFPENLDAKIDIENQSDRVAPTLLNSGDCIKIKCLVSDYDQKLKIEGRIVGIKKIEIFEKPKSNDRFFIIVSIMTILIMVTGITIDNKLQTTFGRFLFGLTVIGMSILFVYLLSELFKKLLIKIKS